MNLGIGSRVRVIGPGTSGGDSHRGREFEIDEAWRHDGEVLFSSRGLPIWFPEESLELADAPLVLSDEAKEKIGMLVSKSIENGLSGEDVPETTYDRLLTRIQDLRTWQVDHDLAAMSKLPEIETRLQEQSDRIDELIRAFRAHIREKLSVETEQPGHAEQPSLKVGDWVEVIDGAHKGHCYKIMRMLPDKFVQLSRFLVFNVVSLRRIPDEEIARRLNE